MRSDSPLAPLLRDAPQELRLIGAEIETIFARLLQLAAQSIVDKHGHGVPASTNHRAAAFEKTCQDISEMRKAFGAYLGIDFRPLAPAGYRKTLAPEDAAEPPQNGSIRAAPRPVLAPEPAPPPFVEQPPASHPTAEPSAPIHPTPPPADDQVPPSHPPAAEQQPPAASESSPPPTAETEEEDVSEPAVETAADEASLSSHPPAPSSQELLRLAVEYFRMHRGEIRLTEMLDYLCAEYPGWAIQKPAASSQLHHIRQRFVHSAGLRWVEEKQDDGTSIIKSPKPEAGTPSHYNYRQTHVAAYLACVLARIPQPRTTRELTAIANTDPEIAELISPATDETTFVRNALRKHRKPSTYGYCGKRDKNSDWIWWTQPRKKGTRKKGKTKPTAPEEAGDSHKATAQDQDSDGAVELAADEPSETPSPDVTDDTPSPDRTQTATEQSETARTDMRLVVAIAHSLADVTTTNAITSTELFARVARELEWFGTRARPTQNKRARDARSRPEAQRLGIRTEERGKPKQLFWFLAPDPDQDED